LKTSLRYLLEKLSPDDIAARMPDLCASYQQAVVDALTRKTAGALAQGSYASLGLSGGVANNKTLRGAIERLGACERLPVFIAEPKHTGDNAGMIAFAAWIDPRVKEAVSSATLRIEPSLALA
jgi:N6-L-threonylcarbamoyladenine synthase